MDKAISEDVMQALITQLEGIVNNYCHNLVPYSEDEINALFEASADEITYYNSLINDNIESQNFIWSSKKIAEQIASAIIESQSYAEKLINNISSIKLKYVETLPTSDISESTIYVLKKLDTSSKDTLNLYNPSDGWTSIGNFDISMDGYYTKTETDNLLTNKANKTEVLSPDDIKTDLTATDLTNSEVAGALTTKTELDKKVDKTNIVTSLDSTVTDEQVPSAKTVYEKTKNLITTSIDNILCTNITTYDTATISGTISYQVKNGICYVFINSLSSSTIGHDMVLKTGFPKPNCFVVTSAFCDIQGNISSMISVTTNGVLTGNFYNTANGWGSFSYPVAET